MYKRGWTGGRGWVGGVGGGGGWVGWVVGVGGWAAGGTLQLPTGSTCPRSASHKPRQAWRA